MSNKTSVVSSDKFTNVQNMRINGKKYSCCDVYYYSKSNAWVYDGKVYCKGWYKKGITVFNKYQNELYS